jgi:hypothetical protein
MQNSLSQKFNQTATVACGAFPEKLKNLVLFSTGADTPVYVAPGIAQQLQENIGLVKNALKRETSYIFARNAAGMAYNRYNMGGVAGIKMIGLRDDVAGVYTERNTQEMRALYVLDHEVGHHVVKSGFDGGHAGECAADAFGALRHIQRYGTQTDFFKYSTKAYNMVLSLSPIHYTEAVFQKVQRLAKKTDISGLSLQETAALAHDIAQKARMDYLRMSHLRKAFSAAAAVYQKEIGPPFRITGALYARDEKAYDLFCRETVATLRRHADDGDVVKACKRFLNYPPMKTFIESRAETDGFYKEALTLAKARVPRPKSLQALYPNSVFRFRGRYRGA